MSRGIVLYDFLYCMGGAEQVTLDMAQGLDRADLCVAFRDRALFSDAALAGIRCHELGRPVQTAGWRTLSGLHSFTRRAAFIDRYDWALFSGSNAPMAVFHRRGRRNFYYCHTIPRFVYDLKAYYLSSLPWLQRPLLRALIAYVRPRYEAAINEMDLIIANSQNVQRRIARYLGHDATVVHPACHVERYQWGGQRDYYLSTARLEPYKRVELIVDAFRQMPGKRLIVASGGTDLERLKQRSAGAENISFAGWVPAPELQRLMACAIATVYIPRDEDFGMSPVESMAAGKPVIGVAEGGLLETVVNGQTGLLLPANPSVEDLIEAVERTTPDRARAMRAACEERAREFSAERFQARMREIVLR